MNREDRRAVLAVARVRRQIATAVETIVAALRRRGRLFFVGAGTSGRLGVLEAAECPPTFGTPRRLVQAIIAGGHAAVFRSLEGAEDDARDRKRSEEHTSELQSLAYLVCRLLLEKKKKNQSLITVHEGQ